MFCVLNKDERVGVERVSKEQVSSYVVWVIQTPPQFKLLQPFFRVLSLHKQHSPTNLLQPNSPTNLLQPNSPTNLLQPNPPTNLLQPFVLEAISWERSH